MHLEQGSVAVAAEDQQSALVAPADVRPFGGAAEQGGAADAADDGVEEVAEGGPALGEGGSRLVGQRPCPLAGLAGVVQ
ncbi:hypothetical protein ACFW4M_03425 [Streptomyces sp. NPDC058794]|uniref:hypothetical protein n=1 Tax=Streptomyces sp. NPDC058794 TaxID=3346636 RepID=UPI003688306E